MTDHTGSAADDLATASVPHLATELPGPKAREWIARDAAVASPSMARVYDLVPARGAGCTIEDVDGNRFLDFNAGIAVTSTGHCHPAVVEAIERQARDLIHYCGSDWAMPGYTEVCDRHGIVLVADEVQSGVGRTGTMWTIEQDDVAPDVLLTGKGLASGLPLAAVVGRAGLFTGTPAATGRPSVATPSRVRRRWPRSTWSRTA